MDTVTYPDPLVVTALEPWILRRADVSRHPVFAAGAGVRAIPSALVVDGSGRVLARQSGFLDPLPFSRWLDGVRADPVPDTDTPKR